MNLNIDLLLDFIKNNHDKKILLFGFTFMIYQHFIKSLVEKNINIDLSNCILIHGGGWKKLVSESIGTTKFRELLYQTCGIKSVHDYYGMVEQTGSIYIECSHGYLTLPFILSHYKKQHFVPTCKKGNTNFIHFTHAILSFFVTNMKVLLKRRHMQMWSSRKVFQGHWKVEKC